MTIFIDIHALHTVPPSNLNRDDTQSPKKATFGGVLRHRVSSQSWKKAIRDHFKSRLDAEKMGFRTKHVVREIVKVIQQIDPSWGDDRAIDGAVETLKAAGIKIDGPKKKKKDEDTGETVFPETGYLLFLSSQQIQKVAEYAIAMDANGTKPDKNEVKRLLQTDHSLDIAAFGRMVAENPDINAEAAVQVAHALGVGPAEAEFDYYTAVDDFSDTSGAGMIGTSQMISSTLYRYATVNYDKLSSNLGSDDAARFAVGEFIKAFIESMPGGKIASYANHTLPEAIVVSVRSDRPVSLVSAFEKPVENASASRREEAAARLVAEAKAIERAYSVSADQTWVIGLGDLAETLEALGESVSLGELIQSLDEYLGDL